MNTTMTMYSIAIAIAGAMTIGVASPTWAAPVLANTAAVATAAPNAATDVRYYRNGYHRGYRNNGGAIVGGLALGVIGAVAADGSIAIGPTAHRMATAAARTDTDTATPPDTAPTIVTTAADRGFDL